MISFWVVNKIFCIYRHTCADACVAMLALDHRAKPNFNALLLDKGEAHFCNAIQPRGSTWADTDKSYTDAGLIFKDLEYSKTDSFKKKLELFSEYLKIYGSLDLTTTSSFGAHGIILDAISFVDGTATIREPYHGWKIDITLKAFEGLNPIKPRCIIGKTEPMKKM